MIPIQKDLDHYWVCSLQFWFRPSSMRILSKTEWVIQKYRCQQPRNNVPVPHSVSWWDAREALPDFWTIELTVCNSLTLLFYFSHCKFAFRTSVRFLVFHTVLQGYWILSRYCSDLWLFALDHDKSPTFGWPWHHGISGRGTAEPLEISMRRDESACGTMLKS